jgi:hypothetical protein
MAIVVIATTTQPRWELGWPLHQLLVCGHNQDCHHEKRRQQSVDDSSPVERLYRIDPDKVQRNAKRGRNQNQSVKPARLSQFPVQALPPFQGLSEGVCGRPCKCGDGKKPDSDNTKREHDCCEVAGKRTQGLGRLPRSFNIRDAVPVEGDGGGQDDEEHDSVGEKCADAHVDVSQFKLIGCCSSAQGK